MFDKSVPDLDVSIFFIAPKFTDLSLVFPSSPLLPFPSNQAKETECEAPKQDKPVEKKHAKTVEADKKRVSQIVLLFLWQLDIHFKIRSLFYFLYCCVLFILSPHHF